MKLFAFLVFLFQIAFLVGVLTLGTYCVNYDLAFFFHKTAPTFWAFVINILTSGVSIILAIVIKILLLLGIIAR